MATTPFASAEIINYTPTVAIPSGTVVSLGGLLGVNTEPIAANALGALQIEGEFLLPKSGSSGPAFVPGNQVYFDLVNQLASRVGGSGMVYFGTACSTAGASATSVCAVLRPHGLPAIMQDRLWVDVDLTSGSKTLLATDTGYVLNVIAGHATNKIILLATAVGLSFVIRCGKSGERIEVDPDNADRFMGGGVNPADGVSTILTAATAIEGNYIALFGDGLAANGWVINAKQGIWA